ncbi:MAG TPA: MFS transporter [Jatrophihabitantaceae bacterium]|nr:MFS transporter [Jatrophihabitantaceae bacterium]
MDEKTIHQRRWWILSVLVICLLVVILDNTILNVALKTVQSDLDASQSQMQWAVDSYALVFAGLLITGGVLGDRLGRKKVLLFGMVAFGATSALCSFANSPTTLILFRALMGIGAAAVQPQTLSIIQNVFEPSERPKAIGIWAGASGMAIALGPIAGGALLKYFWWGSIFLVNVPIVIAGVVAIFFLVPDSRNPRPGRLDPFGVVLSMVALVVLVYGVIEGGNTNEWLRWNTLGAILLGVVLLALFVRLQSRSTHPTIDMSLFRNRHFSAGVGAIGVTFFALMGATFYLAYFLQAVRGYTALAAGVALIAVAGAVMVAAPLSARLSARFGPRAVTGTGMAIFGLTMMSYGLATRTMPQWVIEIMMVGFGVGMGLVMTPATNAIMSAVPREKAGAGSAVNNTVRQVAGALGVAILGSLLAVVFRSHLGADAPAQLANRLDQPAAVVSKLPADARVGTYVKKDASESIGGSLEYVGKAAGALQERGKLAGTPPTSEQQAQAQQAIGEFVDQSKDSFMSAMRVASVVSGLIGLLGAVGAFLFLPTRREHAEHTTNAPASDEPAMAH